MIDWMIGLIVDAIETGRLLIGRNTVDLFALLVLAAIEGDVIRRTAGAALLDWRRTVLF
ncbi:MAG TPA: hypothetical protein VGG38_16440 [Acidimicrobiales bacterium]